MKIINSPIILMLFITFCAASVNAAPAPVKNTKPARRESMRTPNVWRIISMLPAAEQRELLKLQRTDPEKFRAAMQKKIEEFQRAQQQKRQQISELTARIRACSDAKEKAALRQQLRDMIKRDFEARLANMRRNIEASKRRIDRMEKELKRREANSAAVIDAITEATIVGKNPPRPPRPPRPPQK